MARVSAPSPVKPVSEPPATCDRHEAHLLPELTTLSLTMRFTTALPPITRLPTYIGVADPVRACTSS
jgi:hypothetical protein